MVLMKTNIPLYLQYILARYFTATSGNEQISWILEREISEQSNEKIKNLTLNDFDSDISFFPSIGIAQVYAMLTEIIFKLFPFPRNFNALIANMILFHIDESNARKLEELERVKSMYEDAENLLKFESRFFDVAGLSRENIATFVKTLKIMDQIFETCRVRTEENSLPKTVVICYTDIEEMWLARQFGRFQRKFLSVTVPFDYLLEGVDCIKMQKMTPKSFVATWILITTERITRILKMHPGKNKRTLR
jgi:hypothetical protein